MIKSRHNVYPEFSDLTVARWKKTTIHAIAGIRLDPYKPDNRIHFLLMSDDKDYSNNVLSFVYESEVIELYSDREARLFTALNKDAIQAGLLVPHNLPMPVADTSNALTDLDIAGILSIKNVNALKSKLNTITSPITLRRIKTEITPEHKTWFINAVDKRLADVSNN